MHAPDTKYARNGGVFLVYQMLGDGAIDLVLFSPGAGTWSTGGSCMARVAG
jgi:hypothetical protein